MFAELKKKIKINKGKQYIFDTFLSHIHGKWPVFI